MTNLLTRIAKFFRDLWTGYQTSKALKEFDEEALDNINRHFNVDNVMVIQDETQRKYHNGLALLKNKIKDQVNGQGISYDQALRQSGDLLSLSIDESDSEASLRRVRESIIVAKGQDIKTDEDKQQMINKRIAHYESLQKKKLERELIKRIRQAHSDGNYAEHQRLMKEWERDYGTAKNR